MQERMRQDQRRADFAREDQLRQLRQERVMIANKTSDARVENKRRMRWSLVILCWSSPSYRRMAQQQQEAEMLRQMEDVCIS